VDLQAGGVEQGDLAAVVARLESGVEWYDDRRARREDAGRYCAGVHAAIDQTPAGEIDGVR
jgi:hypothetical protein